MSLPAFANLDVWKVAHEVTLGVYRAVRGFPDEERYCLSLQMRRAAVSVEANIAEGSAKPTRRDRRRHYAISRGSAEELRCYLLLGKDLGLLQDVEALDARLDRVCAMLYRLVSAPLSEQGPRRRPS